MKNAMVFILTPLFIFTTALITTPAQEIVVASQSIDDNSFGWSAGNSNGIIEPGESIELKVTLKNDGAVPVNKVQGFLRTNDNSVKFFRHWVNYGDIRAGSFSPPLWNPNNLGNLGNDTFRIKVEDNATTGDIIFNLLVRDDNVKSWSFPITLSIVNTSEISLMPSEDLISEEAFGSHSIYFTLKAKHPTLTGISDTKVTYGDCTITLHIPEDTQAFMFPIEAQGDKAKKKGIDLLAHVVISVASKSRDLVVREAAAALTLIGFFLEVAEFLVSLGEYDLKVTLPNMFHFDPGHPDTEIEYLVLLRNEQERLEKLDITIEQEYGIEDSFDRFTVSESDTWNFDKGWAAPATRPLVLSEYPPFHFLSPEVQQYLLLQFSSETAKTWRIPDETVVAQNFPNPFNPETWIPYQLAKAADVTLTIYDVRGVMVRRLVLGHQLAGFYQSRTRAVHWDGRNELGEEVASGLYFYTFTAGDFSATQKMLILK